MHPDLSLHLHSEECVVLIQKLQECHETNKIGKIFGACNEIDNLLTLCLKKERAENARKNRNKVEKVKQLLKEKLESDK